MRILFHFSRNLSFIGVSCANLINYSHNNKLIGIYVAKIVQMPLSEGSLIPPACRECHNCGSLIPPMRSDATIGVAYYPVMAPMPQWELPHTKVEQAQRTVGLQYMDFHVFVKNQELIFRAIPFEYIDVPLLSKTAMMLTLGSLQTSLHCSR